MRDVAGALVGILLEIPGQRTVTLVLDGEVLGDVSLSLQVCTHGVGRKRYLWSLQIGSEVVGTIGLDGPCTLILVVALTDDTYGISTLLYLVELEHTILIGSLADYSAVIASQGNRTSGDGARWSLDTQLSLRPNRVPYLHIVYVPIVNPLGIVAMRTETDFEQVIAQIFTDRIGISCPIEATRVVVEYIETFPGLSAIAAQLYLHVVNIGLLTVAETQVEAQVGIVLVWSIQLAGLQCLVVIGQSRPAVGSGWVNQSILVVVDRPLALLVVVEVHGSPLVGMERPVVEVVLERQQADIRNGDLQRFTLGRLLTILMNGSHRIGIVCIVWHIISEACRIHRSLVHLLAVTINVEAYNRVGSSQLLLALRRTNLVGSHEDVVEHHHESTLRNAVDGYILCLLRNGIFHECPSRRKFHVWTFVHILEVGRTLAGGRITYANTLSSKVVALDLVTASHEAKLEVLVEVQFWRDDVVVVLIVDRTEIHQHLLARIRLEIWILVYRRRGFPRVHDHESHLLTLSWEGTSLPGIGIVIIGVDIRPAHVTG